MADERGQGHTVPGLGCVDGARGNEVGVNVKEVGVINSEN